MRVLLGITLALAACHAPAKTNGDAPDRGAPDRDAPDRDAQDRDAQDRDAQDRDAQDRVAQDGREGTYMLVLLKSGPRTGLTSEEKSAVRAGHFANMQRLAEERELLVAGPFGEAKHDPTLRGLFILDEATREGAEALAATDPGVKAGVYVLELHELVTDAPLRAYLEHELALEAAVKKKGRQRAPGDGGRTYVLLTADDGDLAERVLAPLVTTGAILFHGRLDGTRAFMLLDAPDVPAAEALLGAHLAGLGSHVLDQWFASGELARLSSFGE